MLASAELMQRHQYNALMHLQGAFRILSASGGSMPIFRAPDGEFEQTLAPETDKDSKCASNDGLGLLFQAVDV
jgi:hypothetical protein